MGTKKETSTVGSLVIQKDSETGELYIELPKETLEKLGWTEDDDLQWIENPDGTWSVVKMENKK